MTDIPPDASEAVRLRAYCLEQASGRMPGVPIADVITAATAVEDFLKAADVMASVPV